MSQETSINEQGFWEHIRRFAAHVPFLKQVLELYYAAIDHATPAWVKASIAGAIAYFILPFDVIPDFIPVIGMADDAGVIFAAYKALASHITQEHTRKAQEWIEQNT
jgi:uncharacterized membrane protein YkvA (DUF1232 family)